MVIKWLRHWVRGDFGLDARDHRAITENVEGSFCGCVADGAVGVVSDFAIMGKRFCGEVIVAS